MFTFNNDKVDLLFYEYITSTKNVIEVKPGKCRYNFRCHLNAVNDALENEEDQIVMCVYMDCGDIDPVIHFINYNDGIYTDNTLGHWSSRHTYYFIRFISKDQFFQIGNIFNNYINHRRRQLNWWLRLTSDRQY